LMWYTQTNGQFMGLEYIKNSELKKKIENIV
jgi:hypothetical protein